MDATVTNYTSTATWQHLHALHMEAFAPWIDHDAAIAVAIVLNRARSPTGLVDAMPTLPAATHNRGLES